MQDFSLSNKLVIDRFFPILPGKIAIRLFDKINGISEHLVEFKRSISNYSPKNMITYLKSAHNYVISESDAKNFKSDSSISKFFHE